MSTAALLKHILVAKVPLGSMEAKLSSSSAFNVPSLLYVHFCTAFDTTNGSAEFLCIYPHPSNRTGTQYSRPPAAYLGCERWNSRVGISVSQTLPLERTILQSRCTWSSRIYYVQYVIYSETISRMIHALAKTTIGKLFLSGFMVCLLWKALFLSDISTSPEWNPLTDICSRPNRLHSQRVTLLHCLRQWQNTASAVRKEIPKILIKCSRTVVNHTRNCNICGKLEYFNKF